MKALDFSDQQSPSANGNDPVVAMTMKSKMEDSGSDDDDDDDVLDVEDKEVELSGARCLDMVLVCVNM